jgi:SMODS and SLOG-associating 2TM effector domain 1/Protein of unknown function (DUF4231)
MQRSQARGAVEAAWADQRIWSETANRLKRQIDRARTTALLLAIATAVLATTAIQLTDVSAPVWRVLTAAAAVTAGVATLMQRRAGTDQIRAWTRARSVSEGLKAEIYSALGGGSHYDGPSRDQVLITRTREITDLVQDDLKRHTLGITTDGKPLPAVHDVDSYIAMRVNGQIDDYYTPNAATYEERVRRLRTLGDLLGIAAVILAALGAAFELDGLALWIPVVTTVAASLTAHITAARYDHLVIEFLRTAERLTRLRDDYQRTRSQTVGAFIDACEDAISVENQAWMARWDQPDGAQTA